MSSAKTAVISKINRVFIQKILSLFEQLFSKTVQMRPSFHQSYNSSKLNDV